MMDAISLGPNSDSQINQYPLLAERIGHYNEHEHIIDMTTDGETSSSSSSEGQPPGPELPQLDGQPSINRQGLIDQASSLSASRVISRDSSFTSRGDGYGHHRRNPLNSGFWISIELLLTLGQIVASIVVLYLSRNENPQAPLFIWVVGYASGCVATLPVLYWRFNNRGQSFHQDSLGTDPDPWANRPSESGTYTAVSVSQVRDDDNFHIESATGNNRIAGRLAARLNGLMEHLKMALDCFFAVWFIVGNVWIFGGHTDPSDAPKLYKLCIVFLTFSCIGYAMPFILCATICCCMPCIISLLGIWETPNRGATLECINSLPTYTFKLTKSENNDDCDDGEGDGGVLAAGTEKERAISSEDAVCCICLTKYLDNDNLRELPCSHVFHVECVDKWLKLNASCPLCKSDICETSASSPSAGDSSQQSTEAN